MATNRTPLRRGSRLTKPSVWERDVSRARWQAWRDHLMAASPPGKRPDAWWDHDAPAPRHWDKDEALQLFELGQLEGDELGQVSRRWRRWEEKAAAGLSFVAGPGVVYEGAKAYREWCLWAGVPPALAKEWRTARKQRTRLIQAMAKA